MRILATSAALVLATWSVPILAQGPPAPEPPKEEKKPAQGRVRFEGTDGPAVDFILPKGWKAMKAGGMRIADYEIPGKEPATCTVYWFGAKGAGEVDANIDRWVAQFETQEKPVRETLTPAEGFKATIVELGGRYVAPVQPGKPDKHDKPGWRLLGAVLETPAGPLYMKLVGPDATVVAARDDFKAWVKGFRMQAK